MTSVLEQRARALDDETKSAAERAREIAGQLDAREKTVYKILLAKRKGYDSLYKYHDAMSRQIHGVSLVQQTNAWRQAKLDRELFECYLLERDGESQREYEVGRVKEKYGFESPEQQGAFVKGLPLPQAQKNPVELWPNRELDRLPGKTSGTDSEPLSYVTDALGKLPERERTVLTKRFVEEKTQEETGKELAQLEHRSRSYSRQRISQIERTALREMRKYIRAHV